MSAVTTSQVIDGAIAEVESVIDHGYSIPDVYVELARAELGVFRLLASWDARTTDLSYEADEMFDRLIPLAEAVSGLTVGAPKEDS